MTMTNGIIEDKTLPETERLAAAVRKWLVSNDHLLRQWHSRSAERRSLKTLSDRELTDIGIDRIDALQEAAKPFWQE